MKMKKLLSLALALALCLPAVPASAYGPAVAGQNNTIAIVETTQRGRATAFIKPDGSLWMWGNYSFLGLGGNDFQDKDNPVKVMDNVASVSGGGSAYGYAAAIKTDGSLWMWGNNYHGVLGDGTENDSLAPKKVMDNVAAVSCGYGHVGAIKTDGSLWMWGENDNGELGNNMQGNAVSTDDGAPPRMLGTQIIGIGASEGTLMQTVPSKVMDNVRSVACGMCMTFAVTTDGTLWGWGRNSDCGLGLGGTSLNDPSVGGTYSVPVKIMDGVASVYAGNQTAAAIKTDGSLWMWGNNSTGQVGNNFEGTFKSSGDFLYQSVPVQVLTDVVSVGLGSGHTCAVKTDGSLWAWGSAAMIGNNKVGNYDGPSTRLQTVPVKIMDNAAAISVSITRTCAVKTDGSLWMWGYGPVTLRGWGINESYLYVPTHLSGITAKLPGASAASASSAAPTVGGFSDVPASSAYADAIKWAVGKNITSGLSSSIFGPGEGCTRGQILTFLWRANGSPEPSIANPFTDSIPASFQKAAVWAYEKGLVSGGTFGASAPCTRAMTVEYLWKAAGSPAVSGNPGFADVPAGADYAQAVAWAVENGVTSGTGSGQFSPSAACTRGQIVTFLYRAMGK